jgi:hypothetical protein
MIGEAILKYDSDCRELFPFLPQTARTLLDVGAALVRLDAYRVHDIPTWRRHGAWRCPGSIDTKRKKLA